MLNVRSVIKIRKYFMLQKPLSFHVVEMETHSDVGGLHQFSTNETPAMLVETPATPVVVKLMVITSPAATLKL